MFKKICLLSSILLMPHAYAGGETDILWDDMYSYLQERKGPLDYIDKDNSYMLYGNGVKAMFVNPESEPDIDSKKIIRNVTALDIKDGKEIYRLGKIGSDVKKRGDFSHPTLKPLYFDSDISAYIVRYYRLINNKYKQQQYVYVYSKKNHVFVNSPVVDVRTGETIDGKNFDLIGDIKKLGNDYYKYYVNFPVLKLQKNGMYKEISSTDVFHFSFKFDKKDDNGFVIKDCIKGFLCDGYVGGGYVDPLKVGEEVNYTR